jgi:Zn finger protein HypA/HybF involved in hydrogenase expression
MEGRASKIIQFIKIGGREMALLFVTIIAIITIITMLVVNLVTGKKEWKMTCNRCGTVWYVSKKSYMHQTYAQRQINDIMACPNCKSKNAKKENVQ